VEYAEFSLSLSPIKMVSHVECNPSLTGSTQDHPPSIHRNTIGNEQSIRRIGNRIRFKIDVRSTDVFIDTTGAT